MKSLPQSILFALLVLSGGLSATQNGPSHKRTTDVSAAYGKAFSLLQSGQLADALAEIDEALLKAPRSAALHNLRGLVAARLGRNEEAEASFRKVVELRPSSAMGYINLATLLADSGRYTTATVFFRRALQIKPHDFTALVGLGTTLAALNKYADAEPHLKRAWSLRPGDFQTGYELARILRELKRPAEAKTVLQRLSPPDESIVKAKFYSLAAVTAEDLRDQAAASRLYLRAYTLSPGSFEIYLGLVRSMLAAGDRSLLRALPSPPPLSPQQHFALGLIFAIHGEYTQAIPHFENTLQMEPGSYSVAYNLALAYKQAGQLRSAIDVINAQLKQTSTGELYDLLASVEEESGHYLEAVRHYQHALELDPTREEYYFDLGAEYLTHVTFEPALEVFRAGIHKFPSSARQYVGMGLAQFALRHHPEATDAFLTALEIDASAPDAFAAWNALPSFVVVGNWPKIRRRLQLLAERHSSRYQALYCYGSALFRHNIASGQHSNLDLAQALLERAVRLQPTFALGYVELANLYAARKQYNRAVATFRKAIQLDPNSGMAHYQLGQVYRETRQFDLAEQELARYTELSNRERKSMAQLRSTIRQFVLAQSGFPSSLSTKKDYP